jgi:hypothetical protein
MNKRLSTPCFEVPDNGKVSQESWHPNKAKKFNLKLPLPPSGFEDSENICTNGGE